MVNNRINPSNCNTQQTLGDRHERDSEEKSKNDVTFILENKESGNTSQGRLSW